MASSSTVTLQELQASTMSGSNSGNDNLINEKRHSGDDEKRGETAKVIVSMEGGSYDSGGLDEPKLNVNNDEGASPTFDTSGGSAVRRGRGRPRKVVSANPNNTSAEAVRSPPHVSPPPAEEEEADESGDEGEQALAPVVAPRFIKKKKSADDIPHSQYRGVSWDRRMNMWRAKANAVHSEFLKEAFPILILYGN
jgi:hypothetical protein